MRSAPRHRSIVAIDIERSTSPQRTNPIREELRHEAYRLLGTALRTAGITDAHCDPLADRGDGVLVLIHPADEIPKTLLLNPLVPALVALLAERNASLCAAERCRRELRLRLVIHAGEIHCDGKGYFGEALDVALPATRRSTPERPPAPSGGAPGPGRLGGHLLVHRAARVRRYSGKFLRAPSPGHGGGTAATRLGIRSHSLPCAKTRRPSGGR
jgi:hypothetical protein